MTDLQKLYIEVRMAQGLKHRGALKNMAQSTGLDVESIQRALSRAQREDERDAKRSARAS